MKSAAIIALAAVALALPAAPSFADDVYYIELGTNLPEQDAQTEWQALSTKYKRQLGALTYYPKKVLEAGTHTTTRMQAGPIEHRNQAEKTCSFLFSRDIPCFVIDGAGGTPPSMAISMSERSEETASNGDAFPWQTAATQTVTPPPPVAAVPAPAPEPVAPLVAQPEIVQQTEKKPIVLPWLNEPVEAPAVANANANAQAHVEVAEAVRVPLSESSLVAHAPVTVTQLPELKKSTTQEDGGVAAGWLNVSSFPDEDMALAFWQGIRTAEPEAAAKLHVRVMKPLLSTSEHDTSLNIGPFTDHAAADDFCQRGVISINPNLRCRFGTIESSDNGPPAAVTQSRQAEDYAARRRAVADHRASALADAQPAAKSISKAYWVQVVSAANQMEALHQWEAMRTGNADLLKGMRGSVTSRLADNNDYVVRIGPLDGQDNALSLCAALQGRQIACRVLASQ